jgi:DNA-binding NarL/FixJ family response regulator
MRADVAHPEAKASMLDHDTATRHAGRLTRRELEVLQLIGNGLGNREIAHRLHVSEETVKTHVQRLLRKLRATTRAHAVARGLRHRLIV